MRSHAAVLFEELCHVVESWITELEGFEEPFYLARASNLQYVSRLVLFSREFRVVQYVYVFLVFYNAQVTFVGGKVKGVNRACCFSLLPNWIFGDIPRIGSVGIHDESTLAQTKLTLGIACVSVTHGVQLICQKT